MLHDTRSSLSINVYIYICKVHYISMLYCSFDTDLCSYHVRTFWCWYLNSIYISRSVFLVLDIPWTLISVKVKNLYVLHRIDCAQKWLWIQFMAAHCNRICSVVTCNFKPITQNNYHEPGFINWAKHLVECILALWECECPSPISSTHYKAQG